jgi:hypothetical protein
LTNFVRLQVGHTSLHGSGREKQGTEKKRKQKENTKRKTNTYFTKTPSAVRANKSSAPVRIRNLFPFAASPFSLSERFVGSLLQKKREFFVTNKQFLS